MAQLRLHRDELARLRTQVLLITFTTDACARDWLRETAAPFPMLRDTDRHVYRAYQLERSLLRVWSPRTIVYYLQSLVTGHRLPSIHGDPLQLGGDFLVDSHGVIQLAHRSRDPVDRPSVARLLAILSGLRRAT